MHLSMFPLEGASGDYPRKLDVFENLGSLEFPTHEAQVCVKKKNPGGSLRTEQNFILYNISSHTKRLQKSQTKLSKVPSLCQSVPGGK